MVKTTKAQRQTLKRLFDRIVGDWQEQPIGDEAKLVPPEYRAFRKTVQPGPDCIMVRYAGMWLGIENDGYTHS